LTHVPMRLEGDHTEAVLALRGHGGARGPSAQRDARASAAATARPRESLPARGGGVPDRERAPWAAPRPRPRESLPARGGDLANEQELHRPAVVLARAEQARGDHPALIDDQAIRGPEQARH